MRRRIARAGAALTAALAIAAVGAAPASAGRIIATGHDADLHCSGFSHGQCHWIKVAVTYVRADAPDPSKPVLILDNNGLEFQKAVNDPGAFGPGGIPNVVMDPSSAQFMSAPIDTATYSAILVASDSSCGGCDLNKTTTGDSAAINARAGAIAAFFNAGGGIIALAGASHGGGNPSTPDNTYYGFVPLPVGGQPVSEPFTLTATGKSIGWTDGSGGTPDDINCCATHNSFTLPPAGSALTVAETDSKGLAETLVAEGNISGGGIVKTPPPGSSSKGLPPAIGPKGVISLPSAKKCLSKRHFPIHPRKHPPLVYTTVSVFVAGKTVGVLRGKLITAGVDLRGLPFGTFVVKIVVVTTDGRVIQGKRTYHTCRKKRLPGHPHLL
jgi:hypothetical protein